METQRALYLNVNCKKTLKIKLAWVLTAGDE